MRWFKHLTLAHDDDVMQELLETFGITGYGAWWMILEKIAVHMDKSNLCSARYSLKGWAKACHLSVKKFQKIVEFLSSYNKLTLKKCHKNSNFLIIECRNLLKFRDEYSKKSGQTPDKRRRKSGATPDQDTEPEANTDTESDTHTEGMTDDQNDDFEAAFNNALEMLGVGEEELTRFYHSHSDTERFIEAVNVTIEADDKLYEQNGKGLDNPMGFLAHAYDSGKVSLKTRNERREKKKSELKANEPELYKGQREAQAAMAAGDDAYQEYQFEKQREKNRQLREWHNVAINDPNSSLYGKPEYSEYHKDDPSFLQL